MTAITPATVGQHEEARLGRTFAMTVVAEGCWALAVGVAAFLAYSVAVYAPAIGNERFVGSVLPVFGLVATILLVAGSLAAFWTRARRRPWFWLIPVVLAVLVLLANAQDIPYDLARPANTGPFLVTIVVLAGAVLAILGGIAAFAEVRAGRTIWVGSGPAGRWSLLLVGIVVGAATASVLAGLASAGEPAGAVVPTVSRAIRIEGTTFVDSTLQMNSNEVLGLFVANPEGIWHSFDIDSLGIHVQLAPRSTTAVMIRPAGPGALEFYCSVHGHRAAGMAGTISVN